MDTSLATPKAAPARPAAWPAASPGPDELGGSWCDDAQCWRGIGWGDASWFEPAAGKMLRQDLDFFPVDRAQRASPLIVYLHPPRDTKTIHAVRSPLYPRLVQAARACGFSLASIEYREAELDPHGEPPADNDIARARRWIQLNAQALGVDNGNVFFVDQSPGSLG